MQLSQPQIIFDFDRTLATLKIEWQFWHLGVVDLIKKYEPHFDPATALDMSSIHVFIERYGQAFRDAFVQFQIELEQKHYRGYEKNEAALALLQQLHEQGKQLYLLSSNSREVLLPILAELNIADYFEKVVAVNDVTNLKPSTAPFALIHDGSPKSDYLMIGDSASDSGFAKNVGIAYVDVREI